MKERRKRVKEQSGKVDRGKGRSKGEKEERRKGRRKLRKAK